MTMTSMTFHSPYTPVYEAIASIRMEMRDDQTFSKADRKHYVSVNSLIRKGIFDGRCRMDILRTLTGIHHLESTKNLTVWTCIAIINELKEEDDWELSTEGKEILATAERFVEAEPDIRKREAMYHQWYEKSAMRNMREDDPSS